MAWHDATCAKLELEWEDGRPACRTCERRAPALTPIHPLLPPPPPSDTPRSELVCTWPPKLLSQLQDDDDEDSKLSAIKRANIDEWNDITSSRRLQTALQSARPPSQQQLLDRSDSALSFRDVYSHLPNTDSIRLLRLHGSGATNSPVCCTLEIHRLRDPNRPIFEAFSYTWADLQGDSSLCKAIFLGPHYKVLPVTTNCLAALRRFRTVADRLIWVDAICINQFDIKERGHQVSLMREIYSSAARVLMYLGDSNHAIEGAIVSSQKNNRLSEDRSEISAVDWKAILQTPYFSRVWVIQEVLLSKTASVTFGRHTKHLEELLLNLKTLPSSIEADLSGNWVEHFGSRKGDKSLFSLLVATRNCRCGDLRDRVYGLMGLIDEEEREKLPVDYSISVQQLYVGLAMYWLTSGEGHWQPRRSEVLGYALLPKVTPFLPSWAPDWAPQSHQNVLGKFTPSVPLTFQFDTTDVERSSSVLALAKPFKHSNIKKSRFGWTLDDDFWASNLSTDSEEKQMRLYSIANKLTRSPWYKLKGWKPGASVRSSSCSGAMTLDAVHILSTSEGKGELTDINGTLLHGLQLTNSGELGQREETVRQLGAHLHLLLDWKQALALEKHADKVYSLCGSFRIACAPVGTPVPRSPEDILDIIDRLGSLDAEIIEYWLGDLFFYGIGAGPAFTSSPLGSQIQASWLQQCPRASSACFALNTSIHKRIGKTNRQHIWEAMTEICEEVMEFVAENEVLHRTSRSNFESYERPTFSEHTLFKRDLKDAELVVRIQKVRQKITRTPSSPQELCTYLENVVKGHRDACRKYPPLAATLYDLDQNVLGPLLYAPHTSVHTPVAALLGPLDHPRGMRSGDRYSVSLNDIVADAWELLRSLEIDTKFTLQQNMNILWIHVLTMEMVARIRGVLQQRLILKAIEDKMRKVQEIYFI